MARWKSRSLTAANWSRTTSMSALDTPVNLRRRARADHLGELLERLQVLVGLGVHRRHDHAADAGVGEALDALGHLVLGADHRGGIDQLVRDRGVGLFALAVEVERLDLVGDLGEAEAAGEIGVEVRLLRYHPAEIEQQAGLDQPAGRLQVPVDRHLHGRRDHEVIARAAALGEAGLDVLAPGLLPLVHGEEDRDPAVGDLGGELDGLPADRAEVDGDLAADRVDVELERLALAGDALALPQRQLEVLAPVLEPALAGDDLLDDLDVLASPAPGLLVGDAVPALRDLRAGGAEAEDEAPA